MSKIRVLSLQTNALHAGSPHVNFDIIKRMDRSRFDVDVCFLDGWGPLSEEYRALGFTVHHLWYRLWRVPLVVRKMAGLVRAGGYDIVHMFGLRANILGRLICSQCSEARIISGQHSVDSHRTIAHVWLDRATSRWVDLYISNSRAGADALIKREQIPRSRVITIHNGVDLESFGPHVEPAQMNPEITKPAIICVANFREAKGYPYLLNAIASLAASGRRFELLVVGDGKLRAVIEKQIADLDLRKYVRLLGTRTDVPNLLATSDILALASLWEGLPGVIAEAMASGLPVVATNVGGIPELVADGKTGFLVPARDSATLAYKLGILLDSAALRSRMGETGHQRAIREFNWESKVRELEDTYLRLLGG